MKVTVSVKVLYKAVDHKGLIYPFQQEIIELLLYTRKMTGILGKAFNETDKILTHLELIFW